MLSLSLPRFEPPAGRKLEAALSTALCLLWRWFWLVFYDKSVVVIAHARLATSILKQPSFRAPRFLEIPMIPSPLARPAKPGMGEAGTPSRPIRFPISDSDSAVARVSEVQILRWAKSMGNVAVAAIFLVLTPPVAASESQQKPPLTNADVISLVEGGLSKDLILNAVKAKPQDFDLSVEGLLSLKKAGVPDAIVEAMLSRQNENTAPASSPEATSDDEGAFWLYDGDKKIPLQQARVESEVKGTLRVMVGGSALGYAAFPESGPLAAVRTTNKNPAFGELAVPLNLRVAELVNLVKVQLNAGSQHRRVQIGKVSVIRGVKEGFPEDVRVPVVFEEIRETIFQGKKARIYRMKPKGPLAPGEYAVVVSMQAYFDFAIDP